MISFLSTFCVCMRMSLKINAYYNYNNLEFAINKCIHISEFAINKCTLHYILQ